MSIATSAVVYWALAVVSVLAATAFAAQRARLDAWNMYLAGMAGFGGALLGGWLYAALAGQGVQEESGARSALGAFMGAAAFGWLVIRLRGGEFLRYADAAVPGIALGYALYRIGCFVNGCCSGIPTELAWGVTFAPGTEAFDIQLAAGLIDADAAQTVPVHPTQWYHAGAAMLTLLALTRIDAAWPGRRLAFALIAYAVARFLIQFFRANSVPVWGALDLNQIICLVMVAAGALVWMSGVRGANALREGAA